MSSKLGFWSVFALVTGSQIGSGVFILPANLAPFGLISLLGWIVSGIGAVMLALVFAKLCARFPRTGGPHAFVEELFGRDASFFTGWTYWVISWVSTTAVISASIGYLVPIIGCHSPYIHLLLELLLLFIITAVNFRGVTTAGNVEFFLTVLKVIPLVLVPVCALFFFDLNNFAPVNISASLSTTQMVSQVALLTLWGFIGVETATTPAEAVQNPSKIIPRAVIFGTICVAALYFVNSLGILGVVPHAVLEVSKAPYSDATHLIFGGSWHLVISLIASIVCVGTLNAWMLTSGQIALGISQDGLLPSFFGRQNRFGAPSVAILISCVGIVPILFLTLNENLAQQVNVIIDISVTAFLFVYVMCCLAYLKLLLKEPAQARKRDWLVGILALSFCGWVIAATSIKVLTIASLFVLSGLPIYLIRHQKKMKPSLNMTSA